MALGANLDALAAAESRSYNFRWYRTDSGLPEGTVMSMAQTPDGYIWCATFNGLARFDGVRFVTFDPSNTPELPTGRLSHLHLTRSGSLIIQTEFEDVVLYRNGRFKQCGSTRSLGHVIIEEDEAGHLWTSSLAKSGICWSPLGHAGKGGITGLLSGFWIVGDDQIYEVDGRGLCRATAPTGSWEQVDLSLPEKESIRRIYPQKEGVWLLTQDFLYYFNGRSVTRVINTPDDVVFPEVLGEDKGTVWIVGYHGRVFRSEPGDSVCQRVSALPGQDSTWVPSAMLDRENNLWIAMAAQGLLQVQPAPMRRFSMQDGLLNDVVRSVSETADGDAWVCTCRGINVFSGDAITALPKKWQNAFAWMAAPRGPGETWLATYSDGLYLFTTEGRTRVTAVPNDRWVAPQFTFLFQDSKGLLWFGNSAGLFSFDGTNTTAAALPVSSPADVRTLVEAKDGTLYAGSNGRGLFVRDKQTRTWRRFGSQEGLESEAIYSLHIDSDGQVWIGTSGAGLARFDGQRFVFFRNAIRELPRTICGIQTDLSGYLWLGSTRGIFRLKLSELNAAAKEPTHPVSVVEFGRSAGLQSSETVVGIQPSVTRTRDGRIWFATTSGLICFDPNQIPVNPLPPPVVIESVESGNCQIDLTRARPEERNRGEPWLTCSEKSPSRITARAGADPIQLEFTGLSFTAPENVQFRYRMEGLESKWVQTHERKALYQRLPPGRYTFHVRACNNNGIWNETGAELAIVQLPFYWQTAAFKLAILGAVALALYAAYRFRMAQLAKVGRLRARIAADLHDEVGGNLGAMVLNSDLLTLSPNLSAGEREQVGDIHRLARETAHAIREISWFINPDFDLLDEMIVRMKETSGRLANGFAVSFSAPEQVPKTRLSLEFRRNVMAIYKESLHNAARHSEAQQIQIQVLVESGRIELMISDDGCGFDAGRHNGGQGLRNLRQRAEAVGGVLEVYTERGAGTRIHFRAAIR
ncbi:MAG TPA: two-component regulator propeller domain-containing protein [Candidatus Acidoferrum sp.]|nr:two-component regulator propeller domain-containing protein [Candidatus Acidoferrum sp.]